MSDRGRRERKPKPFTPERAWNYLLFLLSRRAYTVAELRERLLRRGLPDGEAEPLLTRLQELDDLQRLEELAVMLGANSDASRTAARETLDTARRRAEQLLAEYPRPASS